MLDAAHDVNKEDKYGNSYLTFDCLQHKVKVIEKLLGMGADPNHQSIPLLKSLGRKNKCNSAILELFGVNLKIDVNRYIVEEMIRSFEDEKLNEILDKNK